MPTRKGGNMRYDLLIEGFKRAFEHKGGIKALRLGALDTAWFQEIQSNCAWIHSKAGSSDVTMKTHVTNWTRPAGEVRQFSLFNDSGDSADTKGDYGYLGDAARKRLVFPKLEALARFARLFGPMLRNLRLNGMGPNSSLHAHEENSISATSTGRQFILRFHLPVFTTPTARIFLDDESFVFEEGSLYFFHHRCVHAAANGPDPPRYHLVLDCFLDRTLATRLFPGTPSPDPGFSKTAEASAAIRRTPHPFDDL